MQQKKKDKLLFLWDIAPEFMAAQPILTANHCLGCNAGHGSSGISAITGKLAACAS